MQAPTKAENIYPRTKENIRYIFEHFFPRERHSILEKHIENVYDRRGLELNQIEFAARVTAENYDFIKEISPKTCTVATAYRYMSEAVFEFPGGMNAEHRIAIEKLRDHLKSVSII